MLSNAFDIQKCFLLTRERGIRQVLGGRRRAHRPRAVGCVLGKVGDTRWQSPSVAREAERRTRSSLGSRRQPRRARATSSTSSAASRAAIRASSPLWARNSRNAKAVVAKPPGTRMPASLNADDHFAQRGVLAAHAFDVGHPQLLERDDPCLFYHAIPRERADPAARKVDLRNARFYLARRGSPGDGASQKQRTRRSGFIGRRRPERLRPSGRPSIRCRRWRLQARAPAASAVSVNIVSSSTSGAPPALLRPLTARRSVR